ncbi:Holliday junction resolvase RuvX [Eremococcus coleocola]|uniref:Putative pre-16S rRNA nuclease n=1 Tax=Eremococcus coleocola ACS-139-V-Col8 TaxID=908337 RepID=E4KP14_9LACT|nr:Holliday junction resolvase RuvX [Eremococcus coleocola]EFR31126.1 RNAse H domain protein, YqgF family [Eremococcus coleocola ACS-139-V-Col8]
MTAYERIVGLDVGSKTVGVAMSDLLGWIAQGLETIRIDEEAGDFGFDRLLELLDQHQVKKVVIGLPKNMNNTIGPRAQASQRYGQKLLDIRPDLLIAYQDERLTTSQAERMLVSEGNVSRSKRKKVIDKLAAVIILQNYLDANSK